MRPTWRLMSASRTSVRRLINVRFVTAAHEASTVARIDAAKVVLADAATRDVRADERDAEADVDVPQGSIHSSIQIPISTTRRSRPDVLRLPFRGKVRPVVIRKRPIETHRRLTSARFAKQAISER